MTNQADQTNQTNQSGKGFSPKDHSTSPASLAVVEMTSLREAVDKSLAGLEQGLNTVVEDYEKEASALVDQASWMIYDMMSNRRVFEQVGENVAQLMSAHPTARVNPMGKRTLKKLSFAPLKPRNTQDLQRSVLKAGE